MKSRRNDQCETDNLSYVQKHKELEHIVKLMLLCTLFKGKLNKSFIQNQQN